MTAELERVAMKKKVEQMETKSNKVKEKVTEMEKEVESGLEKAKEEVKEEMKEEMREREEKASNLVIYGMKESEDADPEKRKEYDAGKIKELMRAIEVEPEGEVEVKFRAGKKDATKPRPMIIRINDDGINCLNPNLCVSCISPNCRSSILSFAFSFCIIFTYFLSSVT